MPFTKEELLNLVGNLKLWVGKLERVSSNDIEDPRIQECMRELSSLVSTYMTNMSMKVDITTYTGLDMIDSKIMEPIQALKFDQIMDLKTAESEITPK